MQDDIKKYDTWNKSLVLMLRSKFFNTKQGYGVHAPTEDVVKEHKNVFYEDFNNEISKVPRHIIKIVGDLNAKIGKESLFRQTVDWFSLQETSNENGVRVMDFATNNMVINTCFDHKRIHKEMWISDDGKIKDQTDRVINDKRHTSDVIDIRHCRGADCDTDHFLLVMKYRQRISRICKMKGKSRKKIQCKKAE
ncbi:putative endonuclease-reverse transcriptase [Caerostris extrusa]|uniref:Endonuclease-reverse transcriptase n=1 Tax=Caerostris extrusa TaxID=172846 RepID=A0AAV4NYP7_CAEEX|nr:putative endonuclease-reverse transcriptase [Caerostris extrusa]